MSRMTKCHACGEWSPEEMTHNCLKPPTMPWPRPLPAKMFTRISETIVLDLSQVASMMIDTKDELGFSVCFFLPTGNMVRSEWTKSQAEAQHVFDRCQELLGAEDVRKPKEAAAAAA